MPNKPITASCSQLWIRPQPQIALPSERVQLVDLGLVT